jgi:hypothetical protein
MPRLKNEILDSAVYLYPDRSSAEQGIAAGASGFIIATSVGVGEPIAANEQPEIAPSVVPSASHVYAVTNAHVIVGGDTHLRLNKREGGTTVLSPSIEEWVYDDTQDDLAVFYLGLYEHTTPVGFRVLPPSQLLSQSLCTKLDVGIGDEVFMVGRFISHDRKQRNEPSVRFGHVSMMPGEPVEVHWTHPVKKTLNQDSFLIDGRSMGGYSGSPVYVWTPPYELVLPMVGNQVNYRQQIWHSARQTSWLLGVCWGYILDRWPVLQKRGNIWERMASLRTEANTAMMGVVPCWKLIALLNNDRLRSIRAEKEGEYFASATGAVE